MHEPGVTIHDPHGGSGPADVLGDDGPGSGRGLLAWAAAGVVLLVAVAGGLEVRERRADAAVERELQSVVALETTARFSGLQIEPLAGDVGVVRWTGGLRNTGPRRITVEAASLGVLTAESELVLDPGEEDRLELVQRVPCATEPAVVASVGSLDLRVRTGTGVRPLVLPLGEFGITPAAEQARRACGYLEPVEALTLLMVPGAHTAGSQLRSEIGELRNDGRDPLSVVGVSGAPGMTVRFVTSDGEPARLPLPLAPGEAREDLLVVHEVADCSALQRADEAGAYDADQAASLTLEVRTPQSGDSVATTYLVDPFALQQLLQAECP